MVNRQRRKEQRTDLLAKVEECSAQEATIEALPKRIWEARKVRVDILGVNDQGTELFSGVVQELVSLVALGQRSL